jgi:DNA-3-methyladenine glycosylase
VNPVELLAAADPVEAARLVLGGTLHAGGADFLIVETEGYGGPEDGPWPDPASHSYRGRTPRCESMFGRAGRLYIYRSMGIHLCMNVIAGHEGTAAGVLMRAARVTAGQKAVARRRATARAPRDYARGPGNLGQAAGVTLADVGLDLFDEVSPVRLSLGGAAEFETGPRVGVSVGSHRPWRLWLPGAPEVSAYKRNPRSLRAEGGGSAA